MIFYLPFDIGCKFIEIWYNPFFFIIFETIRLVIILDALIDLTQFTEILLFKSLDKF